MSRVSSKEGGLILILEVESGKVRGTLAKAGGDEKPIIVFSFPCEINSRKGMTSGFLVKSTLSAVEETKSAILKFLSKNALVMGLPRKISAVHYALSYPWMISETKTISVDFHKDTRMSRESILDIVNDEGDRFARSKGEGMAAFEKKIFDVRLNGYSVNDWQGKPARNLEISFAVSIASRTMTERLLGVFESSMPRSSIILHSRLLLENIGLKDAGFEATRYAMVFTHAELTEVVVFHKNTCLLFGSFPFGARTVERKLSEIMKIDQNTASSFYSMYFSGHLDHDYIRPAKEAIAKISMDWQKELATVMGDVIDREASEIIMLKSSGSSALFEKALRTEYPKAHTRIIDHAGPELLIGAIISLEGSVI